MSDRVNEAAERLRSRLRKLDDTYHGSWPKWTYRDFTDVSALLDLATERATAAVDVLTPHERATLGQHVEDGNGGCVICRIWDGETFDEDDELHSIMAWPCPTVRLARLSGESE